MRDRADREFDVQLQASHEVASQGLRFWGRTVGTARSYTSKQPILRSAGRLDSSESACTQPGRRSASRFWSFLEEILESVQGLGFLAVAELLNRRTSNGVVGIIFDDIGK